MRFEEGTEFLTWIAGCVAAALPGVGFRPTHLLCNSNSLWVSQRIGNRFVWRVEMPHVRKHEVGNFRVLLVNRERSIGRRFHLNGDSDERPDFGGKISVCNQINTVISRWERHFEASAPELAHQAIATEQFHDLCVHMHRTNVSV
ncbi:hypothetical protein SAMN05216332_10968 [Nitrosospira briensis]|nr:hypothetical protein SAMN05216332_10968 [Nitrosospira briensis]